MSEISIILHKELESGGFIPFSRFMELALYCPNLGYYERPESAPGRTGDFFTSVSVGPLFGRLLAAQFSEWLTELGDGPLQLVEAGAHDGRLALDILSALETEATAGRAPFWPRLEYWILEPSARRRAWQADRLRPFAHRIRWCDGPERLGRGSIRGVIFSNELIDAFPVARLRWSSEFRQWREMGVKACSPVWEWTPLPLDNSRTSALLTSAGLEIPPELATLLPDGFTLDLAEGAGRWWTEAALALAHGKLLTIDYGGSAESLLHPSRAGGTLRAYRRHRPALDPLADPGLQDLTSQVNFTELIRAGESTGLTSERMQSQGQFLHAIASRLWVAPKPDREPVSISPAEIRQFQTLTHPEHLGRRFQVLVQRRSPPSAISGAAKTPADLD